MNLPESFFAKDYFFGLKNSNYLNYSHYDNDLFFRSIISKIKKYEIKGKALDIGCAFGFLLKRIDKYFTELYGIDISGYVLKRAIVEAPSAKIEKIDIENDELPYPDEYFDLITALDVLEHTKSPEKNLNKIVAKVRKRGYLIITLPVRDSLIGKAFGIFDKDYSHVGILSREELFKIIKNANLEIIEENYFLDLVFLKLKYIPTHIELLLQKND